MRHDGSLLIATPNTLSFAMTKHPAGGAPHRAPHRAPDRAALAAILLAGALGTAWVFIVPIFQAPDEAAHFDYAISIYAAGHLIGTAGKQRQWIVSPYTRYLLRATDFRRVVFHSTMREARDYGTVGYFRRLDAGAPSLKTSPMEGNDISYIAALYPFGFYALEAAWMKIVTVFTGSLVLAFFAARLLCVFLTMAGLYFNYRTAVNIGVPRWLGVALVVAVGFFPLTIWVSSYIQPDNLAYALASAAFFFATQLRAARGGLLTTLALGVCVGLLAITKYHVFVCVSIPVLLLVLAELWLARAKPRAALAQILVLCLPTVMLLGTQFSVAALHPAPPHGAPATNSIFSSLSETLEAGIVPTLGYVLDNSIRALTDFLVTGPNAATYWSALGVGDTPLIVVNWGMEVALRAIIAAFSLVVAALVVYRIFRNASRLLLVARRRSKVRAAVIATSDPLLSSYALFAAFMFTFYAVTADVFGAAGRHWYVYVFASFLCAVWYAPRTLVKLRRRAPAVIAAVAALYSLVASGYATAAVLQRYYGAPGGGYTALVPKTSQIADGDVMGFLTAVQGLDFHSLPARTYRHTFFAGARLWVGGAAVFPRRRRAARDVAVVVDGRVAARTLAGLYDFQIAEATRDAAYAYSGFFATFDTRGFSQGVHVVSAFARAPGTATYQPIQQVRAFFTSDTDRFSPSFLATLGRAPDASGALESLQWCRSDLVLAEGRVFARFDPRQESVPWLLVDNKPYLANYSDDGRSFFGTISTRELIEGVHRITAYIAIPESNLYQRIPGQLQFSTLHRKPFRLTWYAQVPAQCGQQ